jgi:glycosyltransferase involved in cell wall biosynthesis
MKVLHVNSGNMFGGVESCLVTLARESAHAPRMHPQFAASFEGRFSHTLAAAGHAPEVLGAVRLSRPLSVRRARQRLLAHLGARPVDVVVCHQPWAALIFGPVARSVGIPSVLWVHMATDGRHWLERGLRLAMPDAVICNSRFSAARARTWLRGRVPHVVYCPVPPATSQPPAARRQLRRALGADDGHVVVTLAARAEALKGHHVLVEALRRLPDPSRWRCWIAGDAQRPAERTYMESVKAHVAQSGLTQRVAFLGARDDVPALIEASDIYCQPNTAPDAFGLSFVEALGAGVPVVTSAIGGALEIVDETCGVLTPAGDPASVAAALERLLVDDALRRRLGSRAPDRAKALCDPRQQLHVLEAVLGRVVEGERPVSRAS